MTINVVIGTYIEPDLVERIKVFDDELVVHYRPDLLPVPRYACDHNGIARDLSEAQLEEWRSIASLADVYFDFDWLDAAGMPRRSPHLKWVQATSAGVGARMESTGLNRASFLITTAGGIHAVSLSEFALAGALYFVKGVPYLNQKKSEHSWELYTTRTLRGLRALVVGLGGIGRESVRMFAEMGVEVTGLGRTGRTYEIQGMSQLIDQSELDHALPDVDILVLSPPLTKETEGMIGARQLELLPSNAIIVNLGRGALIDEEALIRALQNDEIGGACLDVFVEEPLPTTSPLWDLDNVLISPHSASTVQTENRDMVELFLENLGRWRRGEQMRNLYDPVAGY